MGSEQDSQANEQDPGQAPPTTADSVESKSVEPSIPVANSTFVNKETNQSLLDRIKKSDRWMIGLTAVLAVTGVLGWWVTWEQLDVMKGQLKEMKSGEEQTDKIIGEANRIANSMEASTKQGQAVLEETIRNVRLDQRSWVGPKSFLHPLQHEGGGLKFLKEGSHPSFGVAITNTGKTPARRMKALVARRILPKGVSFSAKYDLQPGTISRAVLNPGATTNISTVIDTHPLNSKDIEILTTEKFILYVYGIITYEDIFEIKHETTFCSYLAADLTSFNTCSTYNDAN